MKKKNKIVYLLTVILILPLILEIFLSNVTSAAAHLFTPNAPRITADISDFTDSSLPWGEKAFLVDSKSTSFEFPSLNCNVHSLSFKAQNESGISSSLPPKLEIYGMDENLSQYYVLYRSEAFDSQNKKAADNTFYFSGSGKISSLALFFDLEDDNVVISELTFNPDFKFSFNPLRFTLLVLISAFICLAVTKKLHKKDFDPNTKAAKLTVLILACLCAFTSIVIGAFMCTGIKTLSYPLSGSLENQSPYVQQFDAFLKGQLHLDVEPSDELKELEDPYDTSLRDDVDYLWDRAYYNGRYYSYFGIAPIAVLYFPFYLISASLPSDALVITFFSLIASIMLCLVLFELTKLLRKRISFLTFILSVPAVVGASMLFLMQRGFLPYYYIASVSASCFGLLFLYFLLKAVFTSKVEKNKPLLFCASGLSFALLMLSRINVAFLFFLVGFAIVAVYLKRNSKELSKVLINLSFFAILPICALSFTFIFNFLRFESILEFGTKYQLTVSNVSFNSLSADLLLPCIYHYFLQPFNFSGEFPYVDVSQEVQSAYGRYVYYGTTSAGIFAFPLNLYLLSLPKIFKSFSKALKLVALTAVASLLSVAFLDMCMGGFILRYTADLSLLASLFAVFCLYWQNDREKSSYLANWVMTITALISFFLLFNKTHVDFCDYSSDIYIAIKGVFRI